MKTDLPPASVIETLEKKVVEPLISLAEKLDVLEGRLRPILQGIPEGIEANPEVCGYPCELAAVFDRLARRLYLLNDSVQSIHDRLYL